MRSNKKSSSTTFKYNNVDDKEIYDVLEDKVRDKSQFIKNALYYYIVKIESNEVIDRNLPQEKKSENADDILKLLKQLNESVSDENIDDIEDVEIDSNMIIPEELSGVSADDYDF